MRDARATLGMQSTSQAGSGTRKPVVGGSMPERMAMMVATASIAPDALMQWPIIDLVELSGTPRGPNTRPIASLSRVSFMRVPVPCALT